MEDTITAFLKETLKVSNVNILHILGDTEFTFKLDGDSWTLIHSTEEAEPTFVLYNNSHNPSLEGYYTDFETFKADVLDFLKL